MDNILLGALVLLFVAVFVAAETALSWWNTTRGPEAKRIARRLRAMSAGGHVDSESVSLLKQRLLSNTPAMQQFLQALPRVTSIDRLLVQSGSNATVSGFLSLSAVLFVASTLAILALRFPILVALGAGVVVGLVPFQVILYKRAKRIKRFEELLPEALDLIGRGLRAGHSFSSALQMAGNEMPEPMGEELRQTFDEINFGIALPTALQNLVSRMPSTDLSFFAIAVMIQRETGGNLSEVLDNISAIIRERLKLFGKVRALSAEGKISASVLSVLPFLTAFLLFLMNPKFMSMLWTETTGQKLLVAGLVMMVLGILWMRKIIRIRV